MPVSYDGAKLWLYASAEDKGLDDSLIEWTHSAPVDGLLLVSTRDYDDQDKVFRKCQNRPDVIYAEPRSPAGLVDLMSKCHGLWYYERSAESFGVTVAIARYLGLEIRHRHVGHDRCGVDEALTADMRPGVVAEQWERVLA